MATNSVYGINIANEVITLDKFANIFNNNSKYFDETIPAEGTD